MKVGLLSTSEFIGKVKVKVKVRQLWISTAKDRGSFLEYQAIIC